MTSNVFHRTMRLLEDDRANLWLVRVAAPAILLAGWLAWFVGARVTVWVVSDRARLETAEAPFPVEASVTGLVIRQAAVVGAVVRVGDILVELDRATVEREREGEESQRQALSRKLEAIRSGLQAEQAAGEEERRVAEARIGVASAQLREADAAARLADENAERTRRLHRDQLASQSDLDRAVAEAHQKRAATEGLQLGIRRAQGDLKRELEDRRVRRERLRSEAADAEAQAATTSAAAARLGEEAGKYVIRAPVSGRIGEAAALRRGSFVKAGDRLATVVPEGELRVVADFRPTDLAGRVRTGSRARLRLDGFPWIQYGSLRATVDRVASETRDGLLRIELTLVPGQGSSIPLQHGLPGVVEVEAERLSPAALLLRNVGRILDASPKATSASSLGRSG